MKIDTTIFNKCYSGNRLPFDMEISIDNSAVNRHLQTTLFLFLPVCSFSLATFLIVLFFYFSRTRPIFSFLVHNVYFLVLLHDDAQHSDIRFYDQQKHKIKSCDTWYILYNIYNNLGVSFSNILFCIILFSCISSFSTLILLFVTIHLINLLVYSGLLITFIRYYWLMKMLTFLKTNILSNSEEK